MGRNMGTTDAPFGFQPYGEVLRANIYTFVTAYATALYVGDPVKPDGTSYITKIHGQLGGIQIMSTGAAGAGLGAILALFDHNGMPMKYHVATAAGDGVIAGYALVADHPQQHYLVQEDGATTSIVAASVHLNVDGATGTGSTNTGLSKATIDSNTVNATVTLAWKIMGVHPDDTIATTGSGVYARFIVMLNTSARGSNVVGV